MTQMRRLADLEVTNLLVAAKEFELVLRLAVSMKP